MTARFGSKAEYLTPEVVAKLNKRAFSAAPTLLKYALAKPFWQSRPKLLSGAGLLSIGVLCI